MEQFSQRDPKVANILLGTSKNTTIGSHGCTITCIAMISGLTPDEVNRRFIEHGVYSNTNLVNWLKIHDAIPWLEFEWRGTGYDENRVKNAISKNGFCLIEVDFDGTGRSDNRHWILSLGNQNIADPWPLPPCKLEKSSKYPIWTGFSIINIVGDPQGGNMADTMTVNRSDWDRLFKASSLGDRLINGLSKKDLYKGNIADKSEAQIDQMIIEHSDSALDLRYKNGVSDGKAQVPPVSETDLSGWEQNGLTIEVTEENKKTITNYKKK